MCGRLEPAASFQPAELEQRFPRAVTLQHGHQPRVDAGDDIAEDPLPEAIRRQPRDDGKKTQGNFFGLLPGATVKTQEDIGLWVNVPAESKSQQTRMCSLSLEGNDRRRIEVWLARGQSLTTALSNLHSQLCFQQGAGCGDLQRSPPTVTW